MMRPFRHLFYGLLTLALLWALPSIAQYGAKNGQWRSYGGELGSTRYSALDQINRDNVRDLKIAWAWKSDNFGSREFRSETTPLYVNGVLYFTAGDHRAVVAADAGSGDTLWMYRMDEGERYRQAPRRNSGRGVAIGRTAKMSEWTEPRVRLYCRVSEAAPIGSPAQQIPKRVSSTSARTQLPPWLHSANPIPINLISSRPTTRWAEVPPFLESKVCLC